MAKKVALVVDNSGSLTKEEMEILARQGKQNELQIDEIEFLTALCCHRKDNKSVLQKIVYGGEKRF